MCTPPPPASHLLECPACWPSVAACITPDFRVYCTECGSYILTVRQHLLSFGKYKGRYIHSLRSAEEQRYLAWFLDNITTLTNEQRAAILYQLGLLPTPQTQLPEWAKRLGLIPPCTLEDIRHAYRTMAKKCHPDAGGTVEMMQELNEAKAQAMATYAA